MNNIHDTLYTMGLMETLCFTATDNEDWWFLKDEILFHMDVIIFMRLNK